LFILFAHRLQRVVVDAGQAVERERALRVLGEVEQQQRLRRRVVAADARALVFLFLVAGLGDEALQLALASGIVALRRRDEQQPAPARRQRAAFDLDVVADVERQRRAGRVAFGVI